MLLKSGVTVNGVPAAPSDKVALGRGTLALIKMLVVTRELTPPNPAFALRILSG